MNEQTVELDGRSRLASVIETLTLESWTDSEWFADDEEDDVTYPIVVQWGVEVKYDPIAWALVQSGLDQDTVSDMTESEAEKHMKRLFGVNKHEIRAIADFNHADEGAAVARSKILNYLTNRG